MKQKTQARAGFYGQKPLSKKKLAELRKFMEKREAMINKAVGYKNENDNDIKD